MKSEIISIIQKAEETLQTARFGYEDFTSTKRERRHSGLRNLIVFGRSVTFVLQNLKTPVGDTEFNAWYLPIQEEMKADALMRYFVTLRNEILKQGKRPPLSTSVSDDFLLNGVAKLGTPPPGAIKFFVGGDLFGAAGWVIELPGGRTEKYYIDVPESAGKVTQHLSELPVPKDDILNKKSIEELCSYYLDKLEFYVDDARKTFLYQKAEKVGNIRLPPYLRVVK